MTAWASKSRRRHSTGIYGFAIDRKARRPEANRFLGPEDRISQKLVMFSDPKKVLGAKAVPTVGAYDLRLKAERASGYSRRRTVRGDLSRIWTHRRPAE